MIAALLLLSVAPPLQVGVATADITPPAGYRMAGSYRETLATGVADPLLAKAVCFAQGDTRFVLVVCDVCGLERKLVADLRTRIAAATGIAVEQVCLSATHTHGGPMHYDPVFLDLWANPERHTLGDYPKRFADGVVTAATDAVKALRPATLEAGIGRAPGLAHNRRYYMKSGGIGWNPGKRNPAIVRPAGPADDAVPHLLASADGRPFAAMVSFPMHVTTYGGKRFSADYPGHLQTALRKSFGDRFVSVFAEGTAGDVNQIDTTTNDPDPNPEQAGERLAKAVTEAKRVAVAASLAVCTTTVHAPLRDDRPMDVDASKATLLDPKGEFLAQVEAYRVLLVRHMRAETGDMRPLPVQAVRLGPEAAIVTLPHEVFVEFGLDIRRRSPFPHTLVVTIANEVDCYVPTRKAFTEGSYEVTNSPYQPGVGELLADAAVKLLGELK